MSAETSQTLGEFLRHERERRGMTIEQVASATKINVRMLHALEADHFAELPAKPFVRGFVTSYCRFIGLTPKEILTRFGSYIDEKAHDRPNRDAGHSGYAFEKREGEQSRTVLWFAMGAFITVGAMVFVFLKPSLHQHHSTHLEKLRNAHSGEAGEIAATPVPGAVVAVATPLAAPAAPDAQQGAAAESAPPPIPSPTPTTPPLMGPVFQAAVASPPPPPALPPAIVAAAPAVPTPMPSVAATAADGADLENEPASKDDPLASGVTLKRSEIHHKVVFKAGDDLWVRYRVDGKPVMRFILRKDRVLVLRARKGIRFQTSAPDSITFAYNGQSSKTMVSKAAPPKQRDGDLTLYFPPEVSKIIKEPFPGEAPIEGKTVPPPRAPGQTSTPSQ